MDPEAAMDNEFAGCGCTHEYGSQESIEQVIEKAHKSNFNALLVQVNGREKRIMK